MKKYLQTLKIFSFFIFFAFTHGIQGFCTHCQRGESRRGSSEWEREKGKRFRFIDTRNAVLSFYFHLRMKLSPFISTPLSSSASSTLHQLYIYTTSTLHLLHINYSLYLYQCISNKTDSESQSLKLTQCLLSLSFYVIFFF